MAAKFKEQNSCLIATIDGEIDHHSAAQLRESIDLELHKWHIKTLVMDFSRLSFMDTSGIGLLMGRYKLISSFGGSMYLCGLSPHLQKIIRLAGLEKMMPILDTLDDIASNE